MASASIFTFEPDPPRVASPWAVATPSPGWAPEDSRPTGSQDHAAESCMFFDGSKIPILDGTPVTRIEAEPQEGPVEYKLHLLLRKRRSFTHSSTRRRHLSGSLRRIGNPVSIPMARSLPDTTSLATTPPPSSAIQSRSNRLEQLTSQMLWRLQQSATNHSSFSRERVNLHFQDEVQLARPIILDPLYPGLEESRGALYELGVADDGELVGLADDEMEESLSNLRIMAASLGCRVEVQRVVAVGECEWDEPAGALQQRLRKSKLLVAEAFIRPDQHFDQRRPSVNPEELIDSNGEGLLSNMTLYDNRATVQLRISLTGATTSGKSSLLGTLSTGVLDNGHGLSRTTLLKHKHEHESGGVTSSITQEIIGYNDVIDLDQIRTSTQVINYSSTDTASWAGIHASSGDSATGRLVLLTDSAGHPRFRRTTVRGLVGWKPHYTLLCIPANSPAESNGVNVACSSTGAAVGAAAGGLDLFTEHLYLCLALELPLLVAITKLDLATTTGLKNVVRNVRNTLRNAGRKTCIVADRSTSLSAVDLETVSSADLAQASRDVESLRESPASMVPIVLTSAVKGTGLSRLHAFLRELPVPDSPTPPPSCPHILFHIEDIYTKGPLRSRTDEPTIVGGHLRYGTLRIGDEVFLGPYPADTNSDDSDSGSGTPSRHNASVATSRSFPGALNQQSILHARSGPGSNASSLSEWRHVRISSLRNLRQPVHTLHAGQVGTIGMSPLHRQTPISTPATHRIRKGMVLANGEPKANRIIHVRCTGSNALAAKTLSIGSAAVVYTASVRASSKVISVVQEVSDQVKPRVKHDEEEEEDSFGFGLDFEDEDAYNSKTGDTNEGAATVVTFQFIASREFVEADGKVLIMLGGGPGLTGSTERGGKGVAGLKGFVGLVVDG